MIKDIESLLLSRAAPPPSADFTARIKDSTFRAGSFTPTFLNELFFVFTMPKPKIMLGLSLLCGLLIGIGLDMNIDVTDTPTQEDIMFYMDEGWL